MERNMGWTAQHPVSHVIWVPASEVQANDYNPNTVAPPEMELLELSIKSDGFTQPIVCWRTEDHYEVIDGFHRHLVGKKLGMEYLPIVIVNQERTDRNDRIASTIRQTAQLERRQDQPRTRNGTGRGSAPFSDIRPCRNVRRQGILRSMGGCLNAYSEPVSGILWCRMQEVNSGRE